MTADVAELAPVAVPPSSWRELAALAAAAAGLLASVGAAFAVGGVFLERADDYSDVAPFSGWQVYSAEAALVIAVLVVGVAFGTLSVRLSRRLHGRSPYGRAVVLAVLLPGLFIGSLTGIPMQAGVSWASDQTAAADAARAALSRMQHDYQLAPPLVVSVRPAAPPGLAALMVQAADLGKGWYAASRPNATVVPLSSDAATHGATSSVHAILTLQHWSGASWSIEEFMIEGQLAFPGSESAVSYVQSVWAKPDVTTTLAAAVEHRVGGVTVWERLPTGRTSPIRAAAAFVVDGTVFTVLLDLSRLSKEATPAELTRVVAVAVQRATTDS